LLFQTEICSNNSIKYESIIVKFIKKKSRLAARIRIAVSQIRIEGKSGSALHKRQRTRDRGPGLQVKAKGVRPQLTFKANGGKLIFSTQP